LVSHDTGVNLRCTKCIDPHGGRRDYLSYMDIRDVQHRIRTAIVLHYSNSDASLLSRCKLRYADCAKRIAPLRRVTVQRQEGHC
jgi:hypothetical protein